MKAQSGIEYLWAYVWTFVVLAVIISAVAINILNTSPSSTFQASSCYISTALNCDTMAILSNSTGTKGVVIFTNGLGTNIRIVPDSFGIEPYLFAGSEYFGGCVPLNLSEGATAVCNSTLLGIKTRIGQQLQPRFIISYAVCQGAVCSNETFNTTGSGTVFVSPFYTSSRYPP
ncbi:MAG: hypothetical protein KGH72_00050 [Candidatus Micrarchaeota archaeon]|nr:hypothetical protein [Candidatus Micrarchaeota archaeon]